MTKTKKIRCTGGTTDFYQIMILKGLEFFFVGIKTDCVVVL